MNGPEHYKRAEELLGGRNNGANGARSPEEAVALAQVHATLALVAATVTTRAFGPQELWGGHSIEVSGEWQEATS